MNLLTPLRTLGKFSIEHAPTICSVAAAGGVVATGVTAAQAGAEYQETKNKKVFIKPVVTGVAAIACIFTGDRLHAKRYAALAGAASVVQRQYDKYINAMEPDIDPLVREDRDDYSANDIWTKCQKNGISPTDTHSGEKLWYEPISEQFFLASSDHVTDAVNHMIETFDCCGYYSFSELLRSLEIKTKPGFEKLIWDHDLGEAFYGYSQIQVGLKDKKLRDGTEYTQLHYTYDPHLDER